MKKNGCKEKVMKHLKGDIKGFKKEANEDRELIKDLTGKSVADKKMKKKDSKNKTKSSGKAKIKRVMEEFKEGELHSGSKKGPIVTNPKQGLAIAISESKRKKRK